MQFQFKNKENGLHVSRDNRKITEENSSEA